jgi:SAM-dependent methyltransferase
MASPPERVETGGSLGLSFFQTERFTLFHPRIHEDSAHVVYRNETGDFAVISPRPRIDYEHYVPRSQKLGLKDPKVQDRYLDERLTRVRWLLEQAGVKEPTSLLEVGASDGTFLGRLRQALPRTSCSGVEPSGHHRTAARERGLTVFESLEALAPRTFDVVCMFHVFEHFEHPLEELARLQKALAPGGVFVIEIPSLSDPLVSLYNLQEFKDFYFQAQHPFVYSLPSVGRLLEGAGLHILATSGLQRYGLANHLHWLKERRPGRDDELDRLGAAIDPVYRRYVEESGRTDTLFVCFAPPGIAR